MIETEQANQANQPIQTSQTPPVTRTNVKPSSKREYCKIYAHLLCYAFFIGILIIFGAGILMIADAIQQSGKLAAIAIHPNTILILIGIIMTGFCLLMFIFAKYWKPLKSWLIEKMRSIE